MYLSRPAGRLLFCNESIGTHMADNVFEIGAIVDTGTLNSGFDEATGGAQKFVEGLNVMFDEAGGKAARAFSGISQASKEMAASITADQVKIAEATKAASEATRERQRAAVLLKSDIGDAEAKSKLYAATLLQEAAATKALAEANRELAGASHSVVSGQQAASAAIRTLEGNAGLRAVENFVAKTLGLGPALQKIFPLIGAFAFGKILFDIGEEAVEVGRKALGAAAAMTEAGDALHEKAEVTNDDLRITSDRLQLAIDKLKGTPSNGVYLALDEARKMADQLAVSLRNDRKELDDLLKEHDVSVLGEALVGVANTGQQHKEMIADQKALTNQVNAANKEFQRVTDGVTDAAAIKAAGDIRDKAIHDAYQKQIDSYKAESLRLQKESNDADMLALSGVRGAQTIDNSEKIAAINERTQQLADALRKQGLDVKIAQQTAEKGQLEQDKEIAEQKKRAASEAASAARQAMAQHLRDLQSTLEEEKQAHGGVLAPETVQAYWSQYIGAFARGTSEYKAVLNELVRAEEEVRKERFESALKSSNPETANHYARTAEEFHQAQAAMQRDQAEGDKAFAEGAKAIQKWASETQQVVIRTGDHWEAYFKQLDKGQQINAAIAESISLTQLRALEASGGITKLGVAQVEAAIHTREHLAVLKALEAELANAEKNAKKGIDLSTGNQTYSDPKEAAEIQRLKNQIAQQQGQGATQAAADGSKIQEAIVAPYKKAFDMIANDFNSTVLSILKGQEKIGQGAKKMAMTELSQGAQMLLQLGEKHLAHYLFVDLLHLGSATKKAAIDQASNAAQISTASATNVATAMSYAAVAAAAAYAATAAIPIVGPELAPGVAGASYAGAASFAAMAAFEQGTMMVPRTGMAVLHPGEAVLGSPAAGVMREMMNGGGDGGGGGDTHFHLGGNQFSGANGDFHSQFEAHEKKITRTLSRWQREGKLAPKKGR